MKILSPHDVLIDVRAANKRQLLEELAGEAAISVDLGVEEARPYLLKREELGSTGVGGGIPFRMLGWRICNDRSGCLQN
jgi:PTS system nitrogen regulatory IIA component